MNNLILLLKAISVGLITGIILGIPLGPAVIESINRTVAINLKAGMEVAIGAVFADLTYILLINLGFKNLFYKSKYTEPLFWIIAGLILIIIALFSYKKTKKTTCIQKNNGCDGIYTKNKLLHIGFLRGYLITFTNPLTPTLWITLSGTLFMDWYKFGTLYYITFIACILLGMLLWFSILNLLAYKGLKVLKEKKNCNILSVFLNITILIIGIGFVIWGLIKFTKIL